jgi:hypothetical protein
MSNKHQKEEPHKALFFDSNTMASDMGKLTVNPLRWIRFNLLFTLKKLLYLVISILLMIKVHWLFVLLFLMVALNIVYHCFMVYNTYKGGDVNPGKVISLNPAKVAVSTNMTKFFGDFPAICIFTTSLPESERVIGKIIPTASLYKDNPHNYPFWAEFYPKPMSHATGNQLYLQNRLARFSREQIATIDKHLAYLKHTRPGTYQINNEDASWKNFPQVDLSMGTRMAAPPKP